MFGLIKVLAAIFWGPLFKDILKLLSQTCENEYTHNIKDLLPPFYLITH